MKSHRALTKFCYIVFAILLFFVLVFFLVQKKGSELDSRRVALVDHVKNNYIFRGNNPFITKNNQRIFAYEALTSSLNDILQQRGLKPLQRYYLIDVSLLDISEYYILHDERRFFSQHPDDGMMLNVSTISPYLLTRYGAFSNLLTRAMEDRYTQWITSMLTKIHDMALRERDKPVVVYIHCDAGRDRTGMIVAAYRLLFKNMSAEKARSKNVSEAGRNSRFIYDQAIESYCLHVQRTYNKPPHYCATRHEMITPADPSRMGIL